MGGRSQRSDRVKFWAQSFGWFNGVKRYIIVRYN